MTFTRARTGAGERVEETPAAALARLLGEGDARVGVVGLGYIGLPLALAVAERGLPVLGFDVDETKIAALNTGRPCLPHVEDARVDALIAQHRFMATGDFARLSEADVLVICVPTPLTPDRQPDLGCITQAAERIASQLRPGQLVILESTTYPGTTAELVQPILARSGLAYGFDFFLAYSPERASPGDQDAIVRDVPRVVGADDPVSAELAIAFYRLVTTTVVPVTNTRTAEATKLLENVFRSVNIALVNELKMLYEQLDIDIWEALDAAATKPFGFMRFDPGPGSGGHCIPVDPFYLAAKARANGLTARFVELAGDVNLRMPEYVVEQLGRALSVRGKSLRGARVLVLGVAYKRDVGDVRESAAFPILDLLLRGGAEVSYHDPWVPRTSPPPRFPGLPRMASVPLEPATLRGQDAVLLVTDHTGVDYELVRRHAAVIVDTRGVFRDGDSTVVRA
jgi:UDP-N-acetyl-D-glucosamine dehydrogenase